MPDEVDFAALKTRLAASPVRHPEGLDALFVPPEVDPFVPQPLRLFAAPPDLPILDAPLLLVTAPAAVGKTTFAHQLAWTSDTPILDLAETPVSTHSLRGLLAAELGAEAIEDFRSGTLPVIVDALDEGLLLSGQANWEQFLRTAFELLESGDGTPGPRLVLFGREDAGAIVSMLLEMDYHSVPLVELRLDFFSERDAVDLGLLYAREAADDPSFVERHDGAIRNALGAFFEAIGKALGVAKEDLWQSDHGRGFAGYAPVLAALGTLIAKTENFVQLENELRETGSTNAWEVLEEVAQRVLQRESEKLRAPLEASLAITLPAEAFDPDDQLYLLTRHLLGQRIEPSPRVDFESHRVRATFVDAVKSHLMEHPFLRDGQPANAVLGSLIAAHATVQGLEMSQGRLPALLDDYSRQPFYWRFVQRRAVPGTLVDGALFGRVLSSLQTDEETTDAQITVEQRRDGTVLGTARSTDAELIAVRIIPPLVLVGGSDSLTVRAEDATVELVGWERQRGNQHFEFLGANEITCDQLIVHASHVGIRGTTHLVAKSAVGDQRTQVALSSAEAELGLGGALTDRYPWNECGRPIAKPRQPDAIRDFLADCANRLPGAVSVILMEGGSMTDDQRIDWARRHGDFLPRLARAMVDHGFANTRHVDTTPPPKVRLAPTIPWAQLFEAYEARDPAYFDIFEALRR